MIKEVSSFEGKRIVFWGIGNVCRMCLIGHPELHVSFFIDSNKDKNLYSGKPVYKPEEISDWKDLFVVITIKKDVRIREYLDDLGLKEFEDYSGYRDFFQKSIRNSKSVLNELSSQRQRNKCVIFADLFTSRQSENISRFIREYFRRIGTENCVLAANLNVMRVEIVSEIIGVPVVDVPSIEDLNEGNEKVELTGEDESYVLEDCRSRFGNDTKFQISLNDSKRLYSYYKRVVSCLMPQKMLVWGCWARRNIYLKHIADSLGIPCGWIEYGYFPGTYIFSKVGLFGYGEVCLHPEEFKCHKPKYNDSEYLVIENKVKESRLDTGIFRELSEEKETLEALDKTKKTLFLVGSSDSTMDMDHGSDMWKRFVSTNVDSTEEALAITKELCKKNNWNLIFKPHPSEKSELKESDSDFCVVRFAPIDDLIQRSDAVVTIGSKVSYKALIYDKPLVEIGVFTMVGQGCSYEVDGDYEKKLHEALEKGLTQEMKNCFKDHVMTLLSYDHWDDLTHNDVPYGLNLDRDFFDGGEIA